MEKLKIAWSIFLTIIGIVGIAIGFYLLFLFYSEDGNKVMSITSFVIGIISFIFTFYSTKILYNQIHDGMICTDKMADKGAAVIADNINSFQPKYIVYVSGNSDKLYRQYIRQYDKSNAQVLMIQSTPKSCICPYIKDDCICTNKFYLDVALLCKIKPDDRVTIIDDITKTGETVHKLLIYLSSVLHVPEANILTCGFVVDKFGYSKYAIPGFYYKRTEVKDNYEFPWMRNGKRHI